MVPANGDGTSIVALSVITSTSVWPRLTASPGLTSQRTSSASYTPSPISGSGKSMVPPSFGTPPPSPLPEAERGSQKSSPSPLRGGAGGRGSRSRRLGGDGEQLPLDLLQLRDGVSFVDLIQPDA